MTPLKAGLVGDMSDSLAGDIDDAFLAEWNRIKPDMPLPTDPNIVQDRQILFVAIARGVLNYLERREDRLETTEDQSNGVGSEHAHHLSFEWD